MNASKLRTGGFRLYCVLPLVIGLLLTPTGDGDGKGTTAGPQATSDIQIVYPSGPSPTPPTDTDK